MSRGTNHIINRMKPPKGWKGVALHPWYMVKVFDSFARLLGTGCKVSIRVSPAGTSLTMIGHIELPARLDPGKKVMLEINLDDGKIYLEGRVNHCLDKGTFYHVFVNSDQPPKSWVST